MKLQELKDNRQYIMVPDETFIKLPDGTIINVAHVRWVSRPIPDYVCLYVGQTIDEEQDFQSDYHDPDGKIYAYFNSLALDIMGESKHVASRALKVLKEYMDGPELTDDEQRILDEVAKEIGGK